MLGGAIIPGVGISLDALTRRTAQLPRISLEPPKSVIGNNTVEGMRSGILLGTACMIDGMVVILESTTYPGTTEELLKPILEASGLKCGEDFYLAFSPERVDPGNKQYKTKNTPKVVGGIGKDGTQVAAALYRNVLEGGVYEVSSPAVAEMEKLLENTYRNINIGLANEMAIICNRMPEEQNRVLTDHISKWLFCPTQTAADNLKKEGITAGVSVCGDVMLDSVLHFLRVAQNNPSKTAIFGQLGIQPKHYRLATLHRAETTDGGLDAIIAIFKAFEQLPQLVVLPIHPRTRPLAQEAISKCGFRNIKLIDPVGYLEMLLLTSNACQVMTDSGGLQKEAWFMKVPWADAARNIFCETMNMMCFQKIFLTYFLCLMKRHPLLEHNKRRAARRAALLL